MAGPSVAVMYKAVQRRLLDVPSKLAERGALRITRLWKAAYAAGTTPEGERWAPNAPSTIARKGHGRVMQETGETMDETRALPSGGAGIRLTTGAKAAWHTEATDNRPARHVLPRRHPPTWLAALRTLSIDLARRAVRG